MEHGFIDRYDHRHRALVLTVAYQINNPSTKNIREEIKKVFDNKIPKNIVDVN